MSNYPLATQAIEELYHKHYNQLRGYLFRLVSNCETAEDLCQETFIKAFRNWHQHDPNANALSWLYRIATNTAYDYLRRRRRTNLQPLHDALGQIHDDTYEQQLGENDHINQTLQQVPSRYRIPLMLQIYAGHSISEIAERLESTPNAIKMRLMRARQHFRQAYQLEV
jgi:RNA polymerase sigma-70 factor (ECF subfamily)